MNALHLIPIPELFVSTDAAAKLAQEGAKLPKWTLSAQQLSDLELLMNGGYFPLKGFMSQMDCSQVEREGRLTSGAQWPVTVKLAVHEDFGKRVEPGDDIGLWHGQDLLAIMSVTDHWGEESVICLGGKVKGLKLPINAGQRPNEIRGILRDRGWQDAVAVFGAADALDVEAPVLRILPSAGQIAESSADDADNATLIARVNLGSQTEGSRGAQIREVIAWNYGATRVHP